MRMSESSGARILVVDDHALNLKLLRCVLELGGYQVDGVDRLAAAAEAIAAEPPDLIVLDLWLPDGDGLDLARRVKADPRTARCLIVACTAGAMKGDRERALEAGCDAYVSKPIDTLSFLEQVGALLTQSGFLPTARLASSSRAD
jgi:CheY-like chemotaxis protein